MKNFNFRQSVKRIIFLFIVLGLFNSCSENKNTKLSQPVLKIGESKLAVPGGNIWYKITGTGKGIPVVLLHGGPGGASNYLKPFEELGSDRQVVRYDQLGGGKSDNISDTTMFTVDHFVNELELLREHLAIAKWHVLGHSWGTILAMEYYKKYPERVASITFGSAALSLPLWEQNAKQLLKTLPESLQQAVKKAESTGNYNDSLYQEANNQFFSLYVFRKPDFTELDSMIATMNQGMYLYMQGPSEFTITGTLKNYDATPFLPKIKVPTLFTVGEFDEANPEIIKGFADKVPDSRYIEFSGSAHMTTWDARDQNVNVVRDFLNSVDSLKH